MSFFLGVDFGVTGWVIGLQCMCVYLGFFTLEWNGPVRVQQLISDLWSCRTDSRPSCSTSVCRALLSTPAHSSLSLCPHKHLPLDERWGKISLQHFSMLSVPVMLYLYIYLYTHTHTQNHINTLCA